MSAWHQNARPSRRKVCAALALMLPGGLVFAQGAPKLSVREIVLMLKGAAPGSPVDLSHRDLSGLDLSGLNFAGANLSHSKLFGVDFTDASLEGAILANAVLDRAILVRTKLSNAVMSDASLRRPSVSSSMRFDAKDLPSFRAPICDAPGSRRGSTEPISVERIFRVPIFHRAPNATLEAPQPPGWRDAASRAPNSSAPTCSASTSLWPTSATPTCAAPICPARTSRWPI